VVDGQVEAAHADVGRGAGQFFLLCAAGDRQGKGNPLLPAVDVGDVPPADLKEQPPVHGLGDVAVAAGSGAEFLVFGLAGGGHHDHGGIPQFRVAFDGDAAVDPVHLRHVQVHVDQVGPFAAHQLQGLLAVAGGEDPHRGKAQQTLLQFEHEIHVIDYQYLGLCHGLLLPFIPVLPLSVSAGTPIS